MKNEIDLPTALKLIFLLAILAITSSIVTGC